MHAVCPWLQLSEQVAEQAAFGLIPPQLCCEGHALVEAT
jgi:hypothetical protein